MKDQELYLKGMNDLHEAMKWYRSQGNTVIAKIFDGHCYAVAYTLDVYKPQDFVNRIENYKKEQAKPKLGDVVEIELTYNERIRAIYIEKLGSCEIVVLTNGCGKYKTRTLVMESIKSITKTGEHIDIQGMLDSLA